VTSDESRPRKNILSGIQIAVHVQTPGRARIGPLAKTELLLSFLDLTASRTGLTCVRRGYFDRLGTSFRDFVYKNVYKNAEPGITKGFGKAAIMDHVRQLKVLYRDQAVLFYKPSAEFMEKIVALICHLQVQLGQALPCLPSI
jgi:hypothetical protein